MNIWRMKLRAGSHGDDMWPTCRHRSIAAITYQAILNTNLTHLEKSQLHPEVKGAGRSSMFRFGWEIKGGDVIFVGDSKSKSIVGRGYVGGPLGQRAYRYNAHNPIREPKNLEVAWRHEVPVTWDNDFGPIPYEDGAPQNTVMHLDPAWVGDPRGLHSDGVAPEVSTEGESNPLNDSPYMRQTEASVRNVNRLHAALSNRFREWLHSEFGIKAVQEKNSIDLTFKCDRTTHLAEIKICYGNRTRAAIREAMGQLLEYNHYPPRSAMQSWWLILDHSPTKFDRRYIEALREKYSLPLRLAWPSEDGFLSAPEWVVQS